MRLLIVSDSPALNSGLGRVVRELSTRFAADGHDVAIAGWFHSVAPIAEEEPCRVIAASKRHPETVDLAIDQVEPDVVLAIGDPWDFVALAQRRADRGGFRLTGYLNVEGGPLSAKLEGVLDGFDVLLTSSRFGAQVIGRPGVTAVHYGVDASVFFPKEPAVTTAFGKVLAETFVVMVNGQNIQRKNISAAVQGFAAFAKDKHDVLLYLNTQMVPNHGEMEGQDLIELVAEYGVGDIVAASKNPGALSSIQDSAINEMYATADVLLAPSLAEGFNLPILEAMATMTVPIATDGFSHQELLADGRGFLIPPATRFRGYHSTDLLMVDPDRIRYYLEVAYAMWRRGGLMRMAEAGHAYALEHSWDRTYAEVEAAVHQEPLPRVATGQAIDPGTRAAARRRCRGTQAVGVLKLGSLGDMLQLSAVVKAAQEQYERQVVVFTNSPWGEVILGAMKGVEHVRIPSMKQEDALPSVADLFSVFLDVRYVSRAYGVPSTEYAERHRWFYDHWAGSSARIATLGEHTTQIMLNSLGLSGSILPVYAPREDVVVPDRAIAVCSGAGHPLKAWPGWDQLAPELIGQRYRIVQVGGPGDPQVPGAIDHRGASLAKTARILEQVAAVITTEGAMHHLAAASRCRAYVLFGPTPVVSFLYPGQIPLTAPGCHPCFWSEPMWPRAACALGEATCVRLPSVDGVIDGLREVLRAEHRDEQGGRVFHVPLPEEVVDYMSRPVPTEVAG